MIGCGCDVCTSPDKRDKRLRTSILVQSHETVFVIDTTPDFRYQMLRTGTAHLDAILFTHPHKDHIAGLDDVRAYNFFSRKAMPLYANAMTAEAIRREFYYAFAEQKYPGVPELDLITIDETPFRIGDVPVIPIQVWHHKMPVFGYRLHDFTYITDANRIDDQEKEKIRGSKVLVLNALRKQSHVSHFTLSDAVDLAGELEIPEVYFTHISHQLGRHAEIDAELPAHIRLAYDGLELVV